VTFPSIRKEEVERSTQVLLDLKGPALPGLSFLGSYSSIGSYGISKANLFAAPASRAKWREYVGKRPTGLEKSAMLCEHSNSSPAGL